MTAAVLDTGPDRGAGPPDDVRAAAGHTRIAPRALDRVVSGAFADALGVSPRDVKVTLGDRHGDLVVAVRAPARLPALGLVVTDPSLVAPGESLLDRATDAQRVVRERVATLTGATVGRVELHFTSARTESPERVR